MVKDTLNSIFDNLKERTTNPFLGTLIVVWVFRNWTLVYGLFNFDKGFTLDKKLKYIADHYQSQAFVPNLLIVVAITFLVLVSTYCMLTLGRLISDTYDKFVLPYLARITDKSSIVLKTEYKALEEVVKQLEIRLEEERLAKVAVQNERDRLDEKLSAQQNIVETTDIVENQTSQSSTSLDDDLNMQVNKRVSDKVLQDWDIEIFNDTINDILNGVKLNPKDDIIKVLLREHLIIATGNVSAGGDKVFKLTDDGLKFLRYWNATSYSQNIN